MAVTKISAVVRTETGMPVLILSISAVVFFITMIAAFAYGLVQNRYVTEYQALAGEQQLLSQRIATSALEAASGRADAASRLQQLKDRFDRALSTLSNGNTGTGLPPVSEELRPQLSLVQGSWQIARQTIDTILEGEKSVALNRSMVEQVGEMIPQLIAIADEAVTLMVEKRVRSDVVYLASRQLMLAQRIGTSLHTMSAGGEGAATAADRFGRDAALFGRVLNALLKGSSSLNVKAIKDPDIISALNDTNGIFANISTSVGAILESSPQLFAVLEATRRIDDESSAMLDATVGLEGSFAALSSRQDLFFILALMSGAMMIVSLAAVGFVLVRNAKRRLEEQTEQGRRNQRAILRLLDELTNLADGDLTTHATVSEDITGAIADSVNYAIDALRSLVTSINRTTDEVNVAADSSRGNAEQLADASNSQAREIASATSSVNDMADTMERVSKNAAGSADVAMKSVDIAAKGADTVRLSIEGMDTIREQIQQTSKRIKRLGESSQEIGDIIGLINDIADQTNILALNAAIQASTAGEAGRGFAVVADEVQRLAERASAATKRVEALVKTIQADTQEAVASMEQSTTGVVHGARLAENAGDALVEIESVSKRLAGLIQNISKEASQQALTATNISRSMRNIREITVQTSQGTAETARDIGDLVAMSEQLRKSVSGFKLPEEEQQKLVATRIMQTVEN